VTIELYPFQKEGVEAMLDKPYFLLADEMGLGKTVQAVDELKRYGPDRVLIVCPKTPRTVWEDHLEGVMPTLMLDGPTRERFEEYDGGACIINYDALRLLPDLRFVGAWDYVIADEAHAIKNRNAKRTKHLKRIKASHRRALTGTPIINRPDELWSILHWLDSKRWSSYWRFFETYVKYVDSGYGYKIVIGPKNVDELKRELEGIHIRRLKRDVLTELPDKTYQYLKLDLTPKQSKAYDQMKKRSLAWIDQEPDDKPLPAPVVISQFTRLRQFADSYCRIDDCVLCDGSGVGSGPDSKCKRCRGSGIKVTMEEPSNKIDALMELADEGEPLVVFSQFKQLINLAAKTLSHRGIPSYVLTGDTSTENRRKFIDEFRRGEGAGVFLAQIDAGGVGIDGLQERATTCVFLDRSYSPAINAQAEDRLHRHGQKNAVNVIIMQSIGTIDMAVETKLDRKKSWIKSIIGL